MRVRVCVSYQPRLHGRPQASENDFIPTSFTGVEQSFLNLDNTMATASSFLLSLIQKMGSDVCE